MNDKRTEWVLLVCAAGMLGTSFVAYRLGKVTADKWYATHPPRQVKDYEHIIKGFKVKGNCGTHDILYSDDDISEADWRSDKCELVLMDER